MLSNFISGALIFIYEPFKLGDTIEVEGNMAYARYDYIIHTTSIPSDSIQTTTTVSSYRKFLDVMRRQSDGSWRVYKHIWNYNEPVVAL